MSELRLIYIAKILVTAPISLSAFLFPERATASVFEGHFEVSGAVRLVGALWGAICVLSILGLFFPQRMSVVLLLQLIYKGAWLLVVALPALRSGQPYPKM